VLGDQNAWVAHACLETWGIGDRRLRRLLDEVLNEGSDEEARPETVSKFIADLSHDRPERTDGRSAFRGSTWGGEAATAGNVHAMYLMGRALEAEGRWKAAIALYGALTLWPIANVLFHSFTDARSFGGTPQPVGFANYVRALTDDAELSGAVWHTFVYGAFILFAHLVLAFLVAVLMHGNLRGVSFYRAAFFAPIVVSPVAIVFTWSFMFDPTIGTVNSTLDAMGLGFLQQNWLGDYDLALYSVIVVDIWANIGFSVVIFLAGLSTIPGEVLEAARVDGAGRVRTVVSIIFPMMRPSFGLVGVLAMNGALRAFDTVYLMTQGGPGGQTELIMTYVFKEAFVVGGFGYASAIATMVAIILVGVVAVQQYFDRKITQGQR
jgi:raffinose/stachyose/melibiose transport system permease protein